MRAREQLSKLEKVKRYKNGTEKTTKQRLLEIGTTDFHACREFEMSEFEWFQFVKQVKEYDSVRKYKRFYVPPPPMCIFVPSREIMRCFIRGIIYYSEDDVDEVISRFGLT